MRAHGISTPYAIRPSAASRVSISTETTTEFPTRPAMKTQLGTGVARVRFRLGTTDYGVAASVWPISGGGRSAAPRPPA